VNVQREGMGSPGPRKMPIQLACNNRAEQDWHPALRSLDAGLASASCLRSASNAGSMARATPSRPTVEAEALKGFV